MDILIKRIRNCYYTYLRAAPTTTASSSLSMLTSASGDRNTDSKNCTPPTDDTCNNKYKQQHSEAYALAMK
jgi:hypothetical protein